MKYMPLLLLLVLMGAGAPSVGAEMEGTEKTGLDAAAQVTGVPLAEERNLRGAEEIKKSNGSRNVFLAAAKRHQLEFAELLGLAREIRDQLSSTNSYEANRQEVDDLLKKNAALQIQALRYVQALEMSKGFLQSGFRPVSTNPQDWDGSMCNTKNECVKLDPITALFTIASAQE